MRSGVQKKSAWWAGLGLVCVLCLVLGLLPVGCARSSGPLGENAAERSEERSLGEPFEEAGVETGAPREVAREDNRGVGDAGLERPSDGGPDGLQDVAAREVPVRGEERVGAEVTRDASAEALRETGAQEMPMGEPFGPEPSGPQKLEWGSLQWPPVLTVRVGTKSAWVYGQVYAKGVTDVHRNAPVPGLKVQLGYGPFDEDPRQAPTRWRWSDQVSYHKNAGTNANNQEYRGQLQIPQAGTYRYTFRYSLDGGKWLFGARSDFGRSGSSAGSPLSQMGVVVATSTGKELRVASYNLHCLIDQPTRRMAEIAKEVARLQLDVVGLQEVCRPSSGGKDSATQLADLLKQAGHAYQSVFAQSHVATHSGQSYDEGVGILTRLPILEETSFVLASGQTAPQGAFPRRGVWARLASPIGVVSFLNTHLAFRRDHETWRVQQVQSFKQWLTTQERLASTFIVTGDFNATSSSSTIQAMLSASQPPGSFAFLDPLGTFDNGPTFSAKSPSSRIDYIFLSQPNSPPVPAQATAGQRIMKQPINGLYLSDHIGIMTTITAK